MQLDVILPALTFRTTDGALDHGLTRDYATRVEKTWVDQVVVSGSAGHGYDSTPAERAALLDLWLALVPPSRLVAACWCPDDVSAACERSVTPLVVLRSNGNSSDAVGFLASLPAGCFVYSHPRYTARTLDAHLARDARAENVLPAGAKLSKTTPSDLRAVREAAGDSFVLWHGSSRDLAGSAAAGANGVVVTPLSSLPDPFPQRTLSSVQRSADQVQTLLDALPRSRRTDLLSRLFAGGPSRVQ